LQPPRLITSSLLLALFIAGLRVGVCAALDHTDGLDAGRTNWTASFDKQAARVIGHRRTGEIRHAGRGAELFEFEVSAAITVLELGYELPAARLIDELKLSVWFQSNQDGAKLAARVVFPYQTDPATGTSLTVFVSGDPYTKAGQWQKLECTDMKARLSRMLPQLRRRLQAKAGPKQDIDLRGLFVDAAVISVSTSPGTSQFVIDELRFGPVVDASAESSIQQSAQTEADVEPEAAFHLDRLHVHGQPFFPRFIPYRGEDPGELARMSFNITWVPDYLDSRLLEDLGRAGLRVIAVPPQLRSEDGRPRGSGSAQLVPFGADTSQVLFWYLGTHIAPEKKQELVAWQEQIRNADRSFKRPLMADVSGLERTYSRHLSMIGVSRPPIHTSFGMKTYRDWLIERRNLAQPGSFVWTWIQTEPVPALEEARQAAGWGPQVVEPEQLRLEVYAALAAGCRGIGYWTHSSLTEDRPGSLERKLMLALLNMELELLEPLIATGNVSGQTPFTMQSSQTRNLSAARSPLANINGPKARDAALNYREIQLREKEQMKRDPEAALIRTDFGMLVLPVWYAEESQYVPGKMTGNDAKIIVPGGSESARAWEISTTDIHGLDDSIERVAGGRQVTLKKFDMTSAVLFTDNDALIERFREKMRTLREPAARVTLELARAKLERVAAVDLELHKLGMGQPDAGWILARAKERLERAESRLRSQQFHDSRLDSADVMQLLRILQHAYWSDAVYRVYSPVTSPHTLCFQTLPDHWRMIARIGRARASGYRNILRSGDCEDRDTMVAEGWRHEQSDIAGVQATAELYPKGHQGTYSLRLIAAPAAGQDPPASIPDRPVSVISPPVTVYKGQIVYISGWVKVSAPSLGSLDGAIFYDSLSGPATALRWRTVADWKKFELVREVHETTELTLTMALSGLGEIRFDDLEIIPLDVEASATANSGKNATGARPGPFDFLKRLPGFRGKTEQE
jgi:hypothetical protein